MFLGIGIAGIYGLEELKILDLNWMVRFLQTYIFWTEIRQNVSIFESLLEQKDLERSTGKINVKYVGVFSKSFKKTIQVDLNKLKGFIDNH